MTISISRGLPASSRPLAGSEVVGIKSTPAATTGDPGRSLALISPQTRSATERRPASYVRPSAVFVAQLAATALDVPQTRARRRCAPEVAAALYAAGASPDRPRMLERKI